MRTILEFKAERSIENGIREIVEALKSGVISNPADKIYYNHYAC